MATITGQDCALYYGTAGNTADTLVENVKDLTLELSVGEADVSTRGSNGWKESIQTLKEGNLTFDILWDTDDAFFTALKTAYLAGTNVAILALDATIASGGQGLDADMMVSNFSRNEGLEDGVTASVTMKPGRSTRAPSWYDGGS